MANPLLIAVCVAGLLLSWVLQQYTLHKKKYARLPPGPQPHPLWGNKIAPLYSWRQFYGISKQYGPLMTLWSGTKPLVVCSSVEKVTDLLEKNARATADRPDAIVASDIFSNGKRILLVGHNERWRRLRKALHSTLQPEAARNFRPVQEKAARTVITDILNDPEHFLSHIQTYAATIVVNLGYGRQDKARYSDPDIQKVILGAERLGAVLRPGAWKIDSFPWLKYVPGYLKVPQEWGADELALFRGALEEARRNAANGNATECFATYMTQNQAKYGLSDDEVAYLCGSIFGAGSDTSMSAIQIAIMAAATHLDQQKRVQDELDAVVGKNRAPTYDDLDDLPTLKAFVHESYRWRPVSSGGFVHRADEDIVYDNYIIPKGTNIVGNHWAVHRDEAYYGPNVEEFKIDRWLDKQGKLKTDMKHFQFGFGRRVCPGQHVANNSVYINTALLLWSFNITQVKGKEIDTLGFSNTVNSHPLPYNAHFEPRIDNLRSVINAD
ncbi:cytochrome P450 [Cystobasidium minutum MCA 4210]|uniref:cytochrome P450 n=1 Tax=Cystobasidium minutum MCA 4210 TaxID=1397322 RepID=UPI0034CE2111|eukprot:jgi/Rhomi1/149998/estExt_Genewise1.C_2_t20225